MAYLLFLIPAAAFLILAAAFVLRGTSIRPFGIGSAVTPYRDHVMKFSELRGTFLRDASVTTGAGIVACEKEYVKIGSDTAHFLATLTESRLAGDFYFWGGDLLAVRPAGASSGYSRRDVRRLSGITGESLFLSLFLTALGVGALVVAIAGALCEPGNIRGGNLPAFNAALACAIPPACVLAFVMQYRRYRKLCGALDEYMR